MLLIFCFLLQWNVKLNEETKRITDKRFPYSSADLRNELTGYIQIHHLYGRY
jgi:ribosomal protein S17E